MIKKIKILNRIISNSNKPLVIAEISANHQNSLQKTFKLLKKAADAGVEAVKFQTFNLDDMTINLDKKEFLIKDKFKNKSWNSRSLYSIYKEAQLPFKWHKMIFDKAESLGLICFSSVFDLKSLKLLEKLKSPAYKIASLESLHFPLIKEVCKTNKPIIISTGTLGISEITELLNFLKKIKYKKFIILHCVSDYPTENKDVNLKFIDYLKKKYGCLVGFSDHTSSLGAAISSVAHGACLIEKHLKLNNSQKSLDHQFSIDTTEMQRMIAEINNAWESIGTNKKTITKGEKIIKKYRRSIYCSKIIKKGEHFTKDNIKIIRPGKGLSPKNYEFLLGKKSSKKIQLGHPINFNLIKKTT